MTRPNFEKLFYKPFCLSFRDLRNDPNYLHTKGSGLFGTGTHFLLLKIRECILRSVAKHSTKLENEANFGQPWKHWTKEPTCDMVGAASAQARDPILDQKRLFDTTRRIFEKLSRACRLLLEFPVSRHCLNIETLRVAVKQCATVLFSTIKLSNINQTTLIKGTSY